MTQKINILHINSYFNGSMFYENLYNEQIETGIDIDVFVPVPTDSDIEEQIYKDYVHIYKCFDKNDRYFFHLKHKKFLKTIEDKMEVSKYDLLHAHSLFSNGFIAYKLNRKYGIPYIVAVRNSDVNVFFKRMPHLRKLGMNILQHASRIIFISESYKVAVIDKYVPKKHKEEFEKKSDVIPNGVNKFWLENINYASKIEDNKINLLYIGDINKNKNIITTVLVCEKLIKNGFSVTYRTVGNIKDESLRDVIDKSDFIEYYPYSTKDKLLLHYRESDIFVMPSIFETFGITYVESMSQGLPIVYTKGQGFDGYFPEGEVGYSVKYDDVDDIYNKILKIRDDYDSISKNCVTNANKFSWFEITIKYINIYNDILKDKV